MINEFRQDLVSGDWVLFATNRFKGHVLRKQEESTLESKKECPFDDPQKSGNDLPIIAYYKGEKIDWAPGKEWTTQVIKNKFPTLSHGVCASESKNYGPFKIFDGLGFHEVVITRDHDRNFADFSVEETTEVFKVYLERFHQIAKDSCGDYISIFHNSGPGAGATVFHNHSQILSMPVIPPEIIRSMKGAEDFYVKNQKNISDFLIAWEKEEGKRIVYENDKFLAFCPFVSRTPYEVRIFPKSGNPRFEDTADGDISPLADCLNTVLAKINKALGGVDYNFYIHSAPITKDPAVNYDFYRWHIEVLPRVSIIGGVELGTNVFVNVVDPDEAAELFRKTKTE